MDENSDRTYMCNISAYWSSAWWPWFCQTFVQPRWLKIGENRTRKTCGGNVLRFFLYYQKSANIRTLLSRRRRWRRHGTAMLIFFQACDFNSHGRIKRTSGTFPPWYRMITDWTAEYFNYSIFNTIWFLNEVLKFIVVKLSKYNRFYFQNSGKTTENLTKHSKSI